MKESRNSAKLLDLQFAPEAEQYLDELERSGHLRIGLEAEIDDAESTDAAASNDYAWGRGSGSVSIHDWWTTGHVVLRVGPGIAPADVLLARVNDALVLRTQDGPHRVVLEGYLGLIPDASTLRIVFADGSEWTGREVLARVSAWLAEVDKPNH